MTTDPAVPPALARAQDLAFLLYLLVLPWTIAPMGIAAGLWAACVLAGAGYGFRWTRTPLDLPALGWAAALALAAVFAVDRAGSLPRLAKALFPLLTGLAAAHATAAAGPRAVAALLGSATLAALVGLGGFLMDGATFQARARGPTGHYMTFAGQLLLFLSLALGLALAARGRWRLGALGAALPLGAALLATFTRSAWLGLVAAVTVMLALWRPRWLLAVPVLVAVAVVTAPQPVRTRLAGIFDPANVYNRERTLMWDAGTRMYRDHPVTGVGLMDLGPLYDRYRSPAALERAGHLHSVPVHVAATMGSVGLAAWLALMTGLALCAVHGLRWQLPAASPAAGVRLGVLGALAGFLVAGLFEWNLGDEELLHPLYALAGVAWAARRWDGSASPAWREPRRP